MPLRCRYALRALPQDAHVRQVPEYTSNIKRDLVNEHLHALPASAWLIYPDADEFFSLPCELERVMAERGAVCSLMVDRLPPGAELPPLRQPQHAAIGDQFPMCAALRRNHKGAVVHKHAIFAVRRGGEPRQLRSSHDVTSGGVTWWPGGSLLPFARVHKSSKLGADCHVHGGFSHFAFSSDEMALNRVKLQTYEQFRDLRAVLYSTVLDLLSPRTTSGADHGVSLSARGVRTTQQCRVCCP